MNVPSALDETSYTSPTKPVWPPGQAPGKTIGTEIVDTDSQMPMRSGRAGGIHCV